MNYTSALFLVNDQVRAVKVSYDVDKDGKAVATYVFKTMDHTLQVGQYVVAPTDTRHGLTVVRVEELDVEVDLDSNVQLKWLVDTVDKSTYDGILAAEEAAIQKIKSAEKRRKREKLAADLLADNPDIQALKDFGAEVIETLSVAAPPVPGS